MAAAMATPSRGRGYESLPPELELPTAVARIIAQDASIRACLNRRRQPKVILAKIAGVLGLLTSCVLCLAWFSNHGWHRTMSLRGGSQVTQEDEIQRLDFCSQVLVDTEFHTKVPLYYKDGVESAEMCCAECDGDPECGAWTWGGLSDAEGLNKRCFLKKLGEDEKPRRFNRTGLSSGLPARVLKKHGIVAGMLAKHEAHEPTTTTTLPRNVSKRKSTTTTSPDMDLIHDLNSTCPGNVTVKGLSSLAVVTAKWRSPGTKGASVLVPEEGWVVTPQLDSRAYLADGCKETTYKKEDYASVQLLGRTLRYSVDLSEAGCGCNAYLHLAAMRSSSEKTECEDYSCDSSGGCGASCADLALQDANRYAWSSSFSVNGSRSSAKGVGYGGAQGRHDWNDTEYGKGGRCIDTEWPFEVAASFLTGKDGKLTSVAIVLAQENKPCTLEATLDQQALGGEKAVKKLSEALADGVTPVFSYFSSNDILWLDGLDKGGFGPCVDDAPQACGASVRFYDFSVSKANETEAKDPPPKEQESLAEMAINLIHDHVVQTAEKTKQEELAKVVAMRLISDSSEPCDGDCDRAAGSEMLDLLNGSGTGNEFGQPTKGEYEESASGNEEWEVVGNQVSIYAEPRRDAKSIGLRGNSDVLVGKREGGWIRLRRAKGFAPILDEDDKSALLKERIVTYEKIIKGNCMDHGLFPITDPRICEMAGFTLGYFDLTVSVFEGTLKRPEGCYIFRGKLYISSNPANKGNGNVGNRYSLCSSGEYPITTTTTTSTTTSSTQTVTTSTTTTWGFPSLYCFAVMMRHSYEYGLIKRQIRERAGIFNCDDYSVYSQDGPFSLGRGPYGPEVKAIWFQKAFVGKSEDGTAGNAKLFMNVFEAIKKEGKYKYHHWTVKADPDAVVLPWRLQRHLKPHTNQNNYLVNCNKMDWKPPFPMIFGALEAYSNMSLTKYFNGGSQSCQNELHWQAWGEDKFMGFCMKHLGVQPYYDFSILADNRCKGAYCGNKEAAAFHDFKSQDAWFKCWEMATPNRPKFGS